jgi:hypothetical protein
MGVCSFFTIINTICEPVIVHLNRCTGTHLNKMCTE